MRTISIFVLALIAVAALGVAAGAAEGTVTGSVMYEGKTVTFKHVYMITGPDAFDPKFTDRTLLFTADDIGAKLMACESVFCAEGLVINGMTLEWGPNPRLNYWVGVNNQLIQIGGTAIPGEVFKAKADTPDHLAGLLLIDDTKVQGPAATAEFDVTLTKAFKTHH